MYVIAPLARGSAPTNACQLSFRAATGAESLRISDLVVQFRIQWGHGKSVQVETAWSNCAELLCQALNMCYVLLTIVQARQTPLF